MISNIVVVVLGLIILTACSGPQVKRTLETDPVLRIVLDPTIPVEHFVQIRRALVQSGKFEVLDRREGWDAITREQNLQHRSNDTDRFSDQERWAHWGKMFGAAGIVTAHGTCFQEKSFWTSTYMKKCKQDLAFIDGRTGVVMFEVSGENSEPWVVSESVPDWNAVVQKAVETYPEYFKPRVIKHPLDQYMDQSDELSKREREKASRVPASVGDPQPSSKDLEMLKRGQQNYLNEQNQE